MCKSPSEANILAMHFIRKCQISLSWGGACILRCARGRVCFFFSSNLWETRVAANGVFVPTGVLPFLQGKSSGNWESLAVLHTKIWLCGVVVFRECGMQGFASTTWLSLSSRWTHQQHSGSGAYRGLSSLRDCFSFRTPSISPD